MRLVNNSNSQAGQESFVLDALNGKRNGFYLEVGAFHGKEISNTYELEKSFNWQGVAIEFSKKYTKRYNKIRKNKCVNSDATTLNYQKLLQESHAPRRIDYLQLDIEPGSNTLRALIKIPFEEYRFSIITFEHDLYASKENVWVKKWSHDFLSSFGYVCLVSNVSNSSNAFEDWWVDPSVVPPNYISQNKNSDIEWRELFTD